MGSSPLSPLSDNTGITKLEPVLKPSEAVTQALQGSLPDQLTLTPHPLLNPVTLITTLGSTLLAKLLPQKQKAEPELLQAIATSLDPKPILSIPGTVRPKKTVLFADAVQSRSFSKNRASAEVAKIKSVSEPLSQLSNVAFQKALKLLINDEQNFIESLDQLIIDSSSLERPKAERLLSAAVIIKTALSDLKTLKEANLGEKITILAALYNSAEFDEYITAVKEFDIAFPIENHLSFIKLAMHPRLEAAALKLANALKSG